MVYTGQDYSIRKTKYYKMKLASHNSISFATPRTWWQRLIASTAKCQSLDIQSQYEYGVRLFDIRLRRAILSSITSVYDVESAHGMISYNIDPWDVLYYLDTKSTDEDPVYVQLNLENLKSEEDRDLVWFKDVFKVYEEKYPNIRFCGGYMKHPWRKVIDCVDPTIEQRNWEFLNFTYMEDTKWNRIKQFFKNVFHFSPKYWANKDNQKYKEQGTDKEFLMLDYVQYGKA